MSTKVDKEWLNSRCGECNEILADPRIPKEPYFSKDGNMKFEQLCWPCFMRTQDLEY